mmetsp:Transcript_65997/g.125865  ORF Transcript_65997/g.125865 Transcript_65997/m.125865 type:complete len:223 (-) Transcript_65997:24-692(-)
MGCCAVYQDELPDYDTEGRNLIRHADARTYRDVDALWVHPETGGVLYVGNVQIADNRDALTKLRIFHVVNCAKDLPNFHEHDFPPIVYHRFNIERFRYGGMMDDEAAVEFVHPMLSFIEEVLGAGGNVLVHCLAGAHRAGTTGVICLMYFARLNLRDALPLAQARRPAIDPIGAFPLLLAKLDRCFQKDRAVTSEAYGAPSSAGDSNFLQHEETSARGDTLC